MNENPIVWNLERAIEHLRGAHSASKNEKDPVRRVDLCEVLESTNLKLSTIVQGLKKDLEEEREEC